MPQNWGLLNNIASGIREGMLAYQTTKQMERQNQMNNLLNGMQENAQTGNLEFTPEMQKHRGLIMQAQGAKAQRDVDEYDPTSAWSKQQAGLVGQNGFSVPDGTSGGALKEMSPLLAANRKGEATEYGRERGMEMSDERIRRAGVKHAQDQWNKVIGGKQYEQRLDGAIKIINLINGAEKGDYKSNQAMLGQLNAEIARLETGAQSPGLHASEKTEMKDSAAKLKDIYDTVSGNVSNVDLSQKFQQARGMVKDLAMSYTEQLDRQAGQLKAGALPEQASVFEQKHNAMKDQYKNKLGFWGSEGHEPLFNSEGGGLLKSGGANNVQTKNIDGVTYQKVNGGWKRVSQQAGK